MMKGGLLTVAKGAMQAGDYSQMFYRDDSTLRKRFQR